MVLLIAEGAFTFHCADETEDKARRRLQRAWNAHLRSGGFALVPVEDGLTVNIIRDFTPGVVYRDYSAMPR